MLRHSVPTFRQVLEALRVEWWESTPRCASTPELRNENPTTSRFYSQALCPCAMTGLLFPLAYIILVVQKILMYDKFLLLPTHAGSSRIFIDSIHTVIIKKNS